MASFLSVKVAALKPLYECSPADSDTCARFCRKRYWLPLSEQDSARETGFSVTDRFPRRGLNSQKNCWEWVWNHSR